MKYPTYEKLKAFSFDELSSFLKKNRYLLPKNIGKIYQKIQKGVYYHNDTFNEVLSVTAIGLSKVSLAITEQLEALKKNMSRITSSHVLGPIFSSLPGGGAVMSAKLLAERDTD